MSNWNNKFVEEGPTFDGVLLISAKSHVLSNDVDLRVELTNDLGLSLSFISVGMDIAIEYEMVIAVAQTGGPGIIYKNMMIINQANEVKLIRNTEVTSEKAAVDNGHHLLAAAVAGVTTDTFERASVLTDIDINTIIIDTVHSYSVGVPCKVSEIRAKFPNINLIVGNAAIAVGVRALYDAGVGVAKVGIDLDSVCTTRVVAGVGVPQITAIYDAANVAREYGKITIVDGGIKYSGDVVKVLAVDSNAVTPGSVLSGIHETPGQIFENQGQKFKAYCGMGFVRAMNQAHGSNDRRFQGGVNEANKLVLEGVEACVAYKGHVKNVTSQLIGRSHAGMDYVGAFDLAALVENVQFVRVANAGLAESHPHDVQTTEQTPSYQG